MLDQLPDGRYVTLIAALAAFHLERGVIDDIITLVAGSDSEASDRRLLQPPTLGDAANIFLRKSHERCAVFGPSLMQDTAWNMLLALFADGEHGRQVSVSSACYASGSASTTALRYLSVLEQEGYVIRSRHASDQRVRVLRLTPRCRDLMATMIRGICVLPPALPPATCSPMTSRTA